MIVEVALNVPLRRTFDYLPPADVPGDAKPGAARPAAPALAPPEGAAAPLPGLEPGCRVIVPFGARLLGGIIVGVKAESDVPPEKLRPVRQVSPDPALFSAEMLAFTRWVADYTLSGWGEVLEAALPSGLGVRFRTLYSLRAEALGAAPSRGARARPDASQAELFAGAGVAHDGPVGGVPPAADWPPRLRTWLEGREWTWEQALRLRLTPAERAWLMRQIGPGGVLQARQEYAGLRRRPRLESWARLAQGQTSPLPRKGRRNARKESRADQVLRVLTQEGPVPLARLKALMPSPASALRTLKAQGLVQVFQRPGPGRLPFGPQPAPQPFLELNAAQQAAYGALHAAVQAGGYQPFLLQGVTGSGKTEVYLHAVRDALAQGRSALVLVPEIALTADMVNRFRSRFGREVAVLHSGMGEGERFEEWSRVRDGRARIVIGARSAVFAPLSNLGLVVVDEEHDSSYKQDETPRYHGRDAAMMRAYRAGAVLVLGTATPSLEAQRNVALGKLAPLLLPGRVQERPLPAVEILDLRTVPRQAGSAWFSLPLVEALRQTLARHEQAILFLNRRGFANLVRCTACQTPLLCANCSIALTWHQAQGLLRCHRCDYSRPLPAACPACQAPALKALGLGTERIAEELAVLFPQARLLRVDSDSLQRRGELDRVMAGIRERHHDIIIGTQILSKGHDFPFITLVGAVLADVSLNLPDFRAPERTFQLLTQIAGRAGRGDLPGRVLVQTYNPDHYSLVHVRKHDPQGFAAEELRIREAAGLPPFASQVLLWMSSPDAPAAARLARSVGEHLQEAARQPAYAAVQVLGPAEAPIKRVAGRWRWMILLKAPTVGPLQRLARTVLDDPALRVGSGERIVVDVDPYNVM